jgi:hypothetical protein
MGDFLNDAEDMVLLDASRDVRDELVPGDLAAIDQLQESIVGSWSSAVGDFNSRQEDQATGVFMLLPILESHVSGLIEQGLSGDEAVKKMADAVRLALCHLIRL